MRNKAIDIESIRAKYKVSDDELETEHEQPSNEQFIEIIEYDVDEEVQSVRQQPSPTVVTPTENLSTSTEPVEPRAELVRQTRSNKNSVEASSPKLLDTTTKVIRNLSRIDLFSCDLCRHKSSTKVSIERHIKQIHMKHKGSTTSFQCEICCKAFSKKSILQSHEKIHMIDRPTFECQHCGKLLSSPTAVSNHIKWLHKDRRDYKCSTCSKVFATVSFTIQIFRTFFIEYLFDLQKGSLSEHEKIHSDYKGHACPICKKTYKTASILVQHLDTHGETEYHCTECGLRLNSKRTLRQHMLKHSDVVRHTCTICSAQFKRTKAYKEHLISLHTELKAYSCDWCEKTFANGANCRKHKKESHPKEVAEADKKKVKKQVRLPRIDELLAMSLETSNSYSK